MDIMRDAVDLQRDGVHQAVLFLRALLLEPDEAFCFFQLQLSILSTHY